MTKKITVKSASPRKVARKVETTQIGTWDEFNKAWKKMFPYRRPLGAGTDWTRAIRILKTSNNVILDRLKFEVQCLLAAEQDHRPRQKLEMEKLEDIELAANLLEARLYQLHSQIQRQFWKELTDRQLGTGGAMEAIENVIDYLRVLGDSAKAVRSKILKNNDGITARPGRPSDPEAINVFLKSCIGIFAEVRGANDVTTTIPARSVTSDSCYTFVDCLHRYALGRPLKSARTYKSLVKSFQEARSARIKNNTDR